MGLYGSPDLSKKYGDAEEYKEHKKKKKTTIWIQVIVLVLLYIIVLSASEDKRYITISYVGIMSIFYFIISFIKMIINLIKNQSVNNNVTQLLIYTVLIGICLALS